MNLSPSRLEEYLSTRAPRAELFLGVSDCEPLSVAQVFAGAPPSFWNVPLTYHSPAGHPPLREHIASLCPGLGADEISVHAGAEEALWNTFVALLERDDQVIVPFPAYPSLACIPAALGCEVTYWKAREEENWAFDPSDLARLIRPHTRMIVINFPHNPTGATVSEAVLREILRIAEHYGLWLVSDEVYRLLECDENDRLPSVAALSERAIAISSLSKAFGLPGIRVGWVATSDRTVQERIARVKPYTTLCNNLPGQLIAEKALNRADAILGANRSVLRTNLGYLENFLERNEKVFSWVPPRAGTVAFLRLQQEESATAFCEQLLQEEKVLLVPSSTLGCWDQHVRIGYGRQDFPSALERLEAFVTERGKQPARSETSEGTFHISS